MYPPSCIIAVAGSLPGEVMSGNPVPLAVLPSVAASAAVTIAACAGSGWPAASATVLILACAVLGTAPLLAPALPRALAPDPVAARRRALLWAGVVASLTGATAAVLYRPATGLAVAALLLPMLVILQTLLGLGLRRPVLLAAVAVLLAAPLWLSPLAELAGSESGVADWIVLLCPLTHLAAVAGCDYLRTDWVYAHSALAGLQRITPSPSLIIVCYVAIAAALGAARADYSPERMQESIR